MTAEAVDTTRRPAPPASSPNKIAKIPGVQLELPLGRDVVARIPGINQSYKGTIVGFNPYDYLIVQMRLPTKIRQELTFGGHVVLKYVHNGSVYGFRAAVINSVSSPTSIVFFEYPAVAERIAMRQTSRSKCSIHGMLQTLDADYECMVVNVSETGCKISARAGTRDELAKTKVGEAMVVAMTMGNYGKLELPIAVRNLSLEKGILSIGAQFLDIKAKEVKVINDYLDSIAKFTR